MERSWREVESNANEMNEELTVCEMFSKGFDLCPARINNTYHVNSPALLGRISLEINPCTWKDSHI